MPKALDVPWDEIQKVVEKGTSLADVARMFGINQATIRMRSMRYKWNTPKRVRNKLDKVAEMQGYRVTENNALAEQIEGAARSANSLSTSTGALDFDKATKDYRSKGVLKMARLLDQTIIAPPRNWKDYDIADKMMRRLLGIDETEGKSNTIVQLQVVNERLKTSLQDEIIEGEFVENEAESVTKASPSDAPQSEPTGCQPDEPQNDLSDIG
jgi:hypothetical protein